MRQSNQTKATNKTSKSVKKHAKETKTNNIQTPPAKSNKEDRSNAHTRVPCTANTCVAPPADTPVASNAYTSALPRVLRAFARMTVTDDKG